jgi:hypothetical protein
MKQSDLKILKRQFDQASDSYVVLGKRRRSGTVRPYILSWRTRQDEELRDCRSFKYLERATAAFNKEASNGNSSLHSAFYKDPQQKKLYDWENECLDIGTYMISQKHARLMIEIICDDYNIDPPKLRWKKKQDFYSEYDSDEHIITLGQHDMVTLLHELAHVIDAARSDDDIKPNHGPGFVWSAIELYHRYAGYNLNYLVTSAFKAGLLGDLHAPQLIRDKCPLRDSPK